MGRVSFALWCCALPLLTCLQVARGDVAGADPSAAALASAESAPARSLHDGWYASLGVGALHVERGGSGPSSFAAAPTVVGIVGRTVARWLAIEGSFEGWWTDLDPPERFGIEPTADGYIDWANAMPAKGLAGALALRAMHRRQAWELFARASAGLESETVSLAGTEYAWLIIVPVPVGEREISGSDSGLLTTLSGGVDWAPLPPRGPGSRFWRERAFELAPRVGFEAGWRRGVRAEVRRLEATVDPSGWFARASFGVTFVRTGPR